MKLLIIGWLFWFAIASSAAAEVYQTPEAFLKESFAGEPPQPSLVWLTGALRDTVTTILGHEPGQLRIRYWREGSRSAWILDEIGKERPITTGILINADRIERVHVLEFRESRGWEVHHDFFTDQFRQAGLTEDLQLTRHIDGISGATLSVRALTKQARLALFLNQQTAAAHVAP